MSDINQINKKAFKYNMRSVMSDIQTVLTRWGVWARDNSHLDYPHIASGFKGLVTSNR